MGRDAIPTLAVALVGPTAAQRTKVRHQLEGSYARIVRYSPDPVSVSESVYVARFESNFVAMYQSRAAVALGGIATAAARRLLRDGLRLAQTRQYRRDVVSAIGTAIGLEALVFAGDGQSATAGTIVPIPPAVFVRDTTGTAVRGVRVVFAVDSGGGTVLDSVRLTNAQGVAAVGSWRLGPAPGTNVLRAAVAGRLVRFTAIATP